MKIYMASSWKNAAIVIAIANFLRSLGHEVDCFCEQTDKRFSFCWQEIVDDIRDTDAISFLKEEEAKKAFKEDKKWLDWCEVCLLVLPCGKSAHLEAGYSVGKGKHLAIIGDIQLGKFDVMYGFADRIYRYQELRMLQQYLYQLDLEKIVKSKKEMVKENDI